MNLGIESEILEFKKTTGELEKAMDNIASMLNKHGHGTVYFGVAPNGEVKGQTVSASSLDDVAKKIKEAIRPMIFPKIEHEILNGKDVIRVDFSGSEKPYSSYGRYYKRVFDRTEEMTPDELKRMMASQDYTSYWENNLTNFGMESVDINSLENFYKQAISCGRIEKIGDFNAKELLSGLGLYVDDKLTNAGYYLFSNKKPVVLKLGVFVTEEKINFTDIDRVEDNIYNLIKKGYAYILNHINWGVERGEDTSRIEVPEIPVEAIREIVVNSFAHADYRGISENEIDITPEKIEIYNPGEFPEGLTPEMFAEKRIKSMPRNKVILNTLYKSKDVEIFGSGFRKVYSVCEKLNIKTTSSSENGGFSFIFYRNDNKTSVTTNVTINDPQNMTTIKVTTDEQVYQLLKKDATMTREQLAKETGKTIRTVQRALDKLSLNGKIRRIGSNKTGYWEVIN